MTIRGPAAALAVLLIVLPHAAVSEVVRADPEPGSPAARPEEVPEAGPGSNTLPPPSPVGPDGVRPGRVWRIRALSADVRLLSGPVPLAVRADLLLSAEAGAPPADTIGFFLNRGLSISDVRVDGEPVAWSLDNGLDRTLSAPDARRITVPAPGRSGPDPHTGEVRLSVAYEGSIPHRADSVARVTPALTELNLYAAWLPIIEGPQGFPYALSVTAPPGYAVVGNGAGRPSPSPDAAEEPPGGSSARSGAVEPPAAAGALPALPAQSPEAGTAAAPVAEPAWRHLLQGWSAAGDVPLIASRSLETVRVAAEGGCDVEAFVTDMTDARKQEIVSEAGWACGFLTAGPHSGEASNGSARGEARVAGAEEPEPIPISSEPPKRAMLRIVVVPRQQDGYARPPLVVVPAGWFTQEGIEAPPTPGGENEWRRRLYHEIAHVFAPLADTHTPDDWINEGLAEHLAMRALAARRGEEAAARYLRSYLLDIAERPPAPPVLAPDERRVITRPTEVAPGAVVGRPDRTPPGEEVGGGRDAPRPAPPPDETQAGKPPVRERLSRLSHEEIAGARVRLAAISATRRADPDATLLYYRKGCLIFRMLQGILGESAWDETVSSLRREYPASSSGRLTTAGLIAALQRVSGSPFDWLRRDWVDGTGLPAIGSNLRLVKGDRGGGASRRFVVVGDLAQSNPRAFRLGVPLVARRGGRVETTMVGIESARAEVRWDLPFRPSEILLDPARIIPRVDATVREALRLRAIAARSWALAQEGLASERERNLSAAMRSYERAAAADSTSAFPWYRRGRVLLALERPEAALAAHRRAAAIAERAARSYRRIEGRRAALPGSSDAPPDLWLDPLPDVQSWNWVRIGQIQDLRGNRRAAVRAYTKALEAPDLRGAHDEARHRIGVPFERFPQVPPATP